MVFNPSRTIHLRVRLLIFLGVLTNVCRATGVNNVSKSSSNVMASAWAIRIPLKDGFDDCELAKVAKSIGKETGLSFHGQIGGLRGHFLLVHETFYRENSYNGSNLVDVMQRISEELEKHPEVEWSMQEMVRPRYKRSLRFKDQYFPSQWHLVGGVMYLWPLEM